MSSDESKYLEAARIAAETASSNTQLTMIVSIIGFALAFIGVCVNAWITHRNVSRSNVIDALTKQRIEWLNTVRQNFVDFNNLGHELFFAIHRDKEDDYIHEKYYLLEKTITNMSLLLNPKEGWVRSLNYTSKEFLDIIIVEDIKQINAEKFKSLRDSIHLNQQIILKSEWKRIKEEVKKGRELEPDEVNSIYEKTSNEIKKFI
ncbi:hypothetical protein HRJ37_16590 [Bacillus altitudinis]|uniref:hypothetical protein n=1 Tax=Bacillus altitudinis TaxID=293387 RepID=UPI001568691A|nr:hypothetical protein [Bacillus altitudinis]QKJ41719.1 hypothetical protein HRJ37_16590 [Bacillus altitudinis]